MKNDKIMINEIIELLPSADLQAKIKETNHQFKENELLQIIYRYATAFDMRIDLLERFSNIATSDIAALAKVYIEYEREKLSRFIEAPAGFVYELYIKETPDAFEEKYLCSSYQAALVCIDRYYEEYADIDAKETEKSRYRIIKRKVFSENDTFEEDAYAECVLGENKTVLEVSDYRNPADCDSEIMCSECKEICPRRCDDLSFPCFVHNYAVIKYQDYKGLEHFGVNICLEKCDGMAQELYVIPLDSSEIREHRFDADFFDHEHIELPLATLASPEDLDETMRKNYFDFVAYWSSKTQSNDEKKIAICDECGSEYLASSSKMASLCPECAHALYGYENCDHVFKDGKCTLCLWDGSQSDYIRSLKQGKEDNRNNMNYYRISKYDPQYRVNWIYQKDEWTSICDIGKSFDGTTFTEDEYYKVEQSYVDFILRVCDLQGIDHLTIADLENHNKLRWINGQQLNAHQSGEFIKLCLREQIWGRLVSKGFVFETGYEYYIHIGCELGFDEIKQLARHNNLFIEEWEQILTEQ